MPPSPAEPERLRRHPVRDTLFFMLLLVVCALAARVFVVEAFVIPSGSMAPTLLGVHRHVRCGACGHAFDVDGAPGATGGDLHCPLCRGKVEADGPTLGGDRILVDKFPARPHRWDVVVFRSPQDGDPLLPRSETPGPNIFFIKRAVGLPGEDIHLLDGHVYVRKPGEASFTIARRADPAENPRWEAVARAMWRPVWRKDQAEGGVSFDFEEKAPGERPAYDDATLHPYNQTAQGLRHRASETVEDVRLAARTRGAASFACSAPFAGGLALLRTADGHLRLLAGATELGRAPVPGGAAADAFLELWLLDREALVFADGRCVLRHAFDQPWAEVLAAPAPPDHPDIRFCGTLEDVQLDAALPYLPGGRGLESAWGGLVRAEGGRVVMAQPVALPSGDGDAEACWFCLGDNSPSSTDGRYWKNLHPEVEQRLLGGHPFYGCVPESLMVGRAWGVFWPVADGGGMLPEWGKIRRIR